MFLYQSRKVRTLRRIIKEYYAIRASVLSHNCTFHDEQIIIILINGLFTIFSRALVQE
jgi:hypothetical protein